MSLPTAIPPLIVVIGIAAVLFGFFRHLVTKALGFLVLEIVFLVIFPGSLVLLAHIVASIRNGLGL